ncbi:MAG: twin-arginine translocation signal domain-containing protein [Pseudomonadota bacterium]|nr:twin-arginine translocation signal domain-containing protein [Pseudomonadota bacterium]
MRRFLQDVSAATAVLGFAWMIAMWGSVLGAA